MGMRTMTISLSPQQAERIEEAVRSGEYASNSEVLRDALRLWERKQELAKLELDRLRAAFQAGLESGPSVLFSADEFLRAVKSKQRGDGA